MRAALVLSVLLMALVPAGLVLTASPALAVQPDEVLADPALEARARAISRDGDARPHAVPVRVGTPVRPARLAMPTRSSATGWPASSDRYIASASNGSTPITLMRAPVRGSS